MSYQVLARKWRPQTFQQMVGQRHVLKALVNALDNQRLHHAYLFTGTRGVGKTTLARLFAKSLNCEEGVSSNPCGVCGSCVEIAENRFVDLIEVDAASRTKVEDTRELLDNVQYAPTRGRYKVYLIDEVHMLSNHSFNALLKTLEEPPPHVKFLLATTDPQKLPVTVLSRCLQFNLKSMTPEMVVDHLADVLQQESVSFEQGALLHLGKAAQGSMRDALSLTDQAVAYGQGEVREAEVAEMLGTVDTRQVVSLIEALCEQDAGRVLRQVQALADFSPDWQHMMADVLAMLHQLTVLQLAPDYELPAHQSALQSLAGRFAPEDVQLYYQMGLQAHKDLESAPEARQGFEMALLRMLTFTPDFARVPRQHNPPASGAQARESQTESADPDPAAKPTTESVDPAPERNADMPQPEPAPEPSEAPPWDPEPQPEPAAPVGSETTRANEPPNEEPLADAAPEAWADNMAADNAGAAVADEPGEMIEQVAPASLAGSILDDTTAGGEAAVPVERFPLESAPSAEPTGEQSVSPAHYEEATARALDSVRADVASLPDHWIDLVPALELKGVTGNLVKHAVVLDLQASHLTLAVHPDYAQLYQPAYGERVLEAVQAHDIAVERLDIEFQEPGEETWHQRAQRHRKEAYNRARKALEDDVLVQQLVSQLGGELLSDTVEPVTNQD